MPRFEYFAPKNVEEVLFLLSEYKGKAKVLAGGTDLLIRIKERKATPAYIIGLAEVPGLDFIKAGDDRGLRLGALATHQSIVDSTLFRGKYALLATACRKIGTPQIRNMGTIGGNLCNAGPSTDSAPPLLTLGTMLKLTSISGQREVPLDEFFVAPFQTVMREDELLTEIVVPPLPRRSGGSYHWLTKITAIDETLVGVAALVILDGSGKEIQDARIALCSVAPTPMRAKKAEEVLKGKKVTEMLIDKAAEIVGSETRPRSMADYRKRMSLVLARRTIKEAIDKARNQEG
ncbi:MAG: hypothetical protein A2157_09940 [Deltaproteobacteria bacterium RBG_16_47_11]|nr:MAG: hypothetical protein A2157_09940 [Deltaproteobacteria bacterium RBG_16_47_11]